MKDYYEILEVSKNASKEVIEKAYKVLAKKYHPDVQEQDQRKNAENKMKLINEAYEILSDETKKQEYDNELEYERQQKEVQTEQRQQEQYDQYEQYAEYDQAQDTQTTRQQRKAEKKAEKEARRKYQDEQEKMYENFYRSLGYKIKKRWTWKRIKKLLKAIAVVALIMLIIWIFPPTRNMLIKTYNENNIIKVIVDLMMNIYKGIVNGIDTFFKSVFSQ